MLFLNNSPLLNPSTAFHLVEIASFVFISSVYESLVKFCNYSKQWVWEETQLTPSKQTTQLVGIDVQMT